MLKPNLRGTSCNVAEVPEIISTPKVTDSVEKRDTSKELFHLLKCERNPEYENGLRFLPSFDTCLIGINDTKSNAIKSRPFVVKTKPKWKTTLGYYNVDVKTGEIDGKGEYITDEFKKSNAKKIKSLDAFADHYNEPYMKKKISVLFHTFTRANASKNGMKMRRMVHLTRKRYKSLGYNVTGYIWTAEVTDEHESKGKGLMWHYHLAVALDRRLTIKGKQLPKKLMLESLWGQRTEVEFVRENVRHYMAKYFAKHNARVIGSRSYGRSRRFLK
jgi:hypothetical protein